MGSLRTSLKVSGPYRARHYAYFHGGVWSLNEHVASEVTELTSAWPYQPGSSTNASVEVVEVGGHEQFDESYYVPGGWVAENEASDAGRIRAQWVAGYSVEEDTGEGSLASVTITGANRFTNCEPDDKYPLTRARLWYSIEAVGGDRIVRLFANGSLVASGSRTGDGLVTLSENNLSGLSGSALLTYSADVTIDTAFLQLQWAKKYYFHYSTSPLSYPRTPEMVVYDRGVTNYVAITPVLDSGTYNYAIQAVSDEGVEQDPPDVPSDSPKLIYGPPLPVTHVSQTGTASAITVNWLPGEPYCWFTVYSSLVDEPVNTGQWPTPWPINKPVGSTSCTLQPVLNHAPLDRTAEWDAFTSGMLDVVANMNAAWDAGMTGFTDALDAQAERARNFLLGLQEGIDVPVNDLLEQQVMAFTAVRETAVLFSDSEDDDDFREGIHAAFSTFLNEMSLIVHGRTSAYTFSDGSLPFSGTGTEDGEDGTSNQGDGLAARIGAYDLSHPLVTNRIVRVIIRATSALTGLQEASDEVVEMELDENGDMVQPRPNKASIYSVESAGLTVTFGVQYRTDDQKAAPSRLNVYYAAAPSSPTYVVPQGQVSAGTETYGLITGNVTITFPSKGYYVVAAKAESAAGTTSSYAKETTIWVGDEQPAGPTGVKASVIRNAPSQAMEDGS